MPNNNGSQTLSSEKQVAVVDHNATLLQSESKPGKQSKSAAKESW
jgi:hypothetical protein